jgi:glycosyltransferase involved in cell wall biosynthesis
MPTSPPGVLLLTLPYASLIPLRHARKLVDMLAPNCRLLFVFCDPRLDLSGQPEHVQRAARLPALHRRQDIRPPLWSVLLWLVKLGFIILSALWTVWRTRRQVQMIVCFLEVFFMPALLLGRLIGKQVVYFEPSNTIIDEAQGFGKLKWGKLWIITRGWLRKLNRRIAHRLVVESMHEVEQGQLQPFLSKLRAIPQYVNTELYYPVVPLEARPLQVGYAGRLAEVKGIRQFLAAIAGLQDSGYTFLVVGDGDLRSEVEQALRSPSLAHARYLGWADELAFAGYLNQLRLLVLPTAGEGLPNVLLEAMSSGTPVLATAVGGIPDLIVPGVTGFLLPDRSPASLCLAIQSAMLNPELDSIVRRARQLVLEQFSLPAAARRWGELLNEVAGCA